MVGLGEVFLYSEFRANGLTVLCGKLRPAVCQKADRRTLDGHPVFTESFCNRHGGSRPHLHRASDLGNGRRSPRGIDYHVGSWSMDPGCPLQLTPKGQFAGNSLNRFVLFARLILLRVQSSHFFTVYTTSSAMVGQKYERRSVRSIWLVPGCTDVFG
jgi:hypothetical protein